MTLTEAIEINENLLTDDPHFDPELRRKAVKLGLEALNRCRHNYLNPQRADFRLLPGETEE